MGCTVFAPVQSVLYLVLDCCKQLFLCSRLLEWVDSCGSDPCAISPSPAIVVIAQSQLSSIRSLAAVCSVHQVIAIPI